MAATFNMIFKISGILGGEECSIGELYSPYQISTSADIKFQSIVSVANATSTEILSIGAGEDLASAVAIVILPTVAGTLVWEGATAADNSGVRLRAGIPFILPTGNTVPYQTTSSDRADETAEAITSIVFYQSTGGAATVRVWGIG